MAKKRGGIAGIWDRNKQFITPAAAGIAGLLGTPALGAAVGATMRGLDREGKRGIGVDLGNAAKGALEGYAAGQAGNMLGGAAGIGKVGALQEAGNAISAPFSKGASAVKGMLTGNASAATSVPGAPTPTPTPNPGAPTSWSSAMKNPQVIAGAIQAGVGMIPSAADRAKADIAQGELEATRGALDLNKQKFAFDKQQYEDDQRRKQYIAQLLMPMYQQMLGKYGMGAGTGTGATGTQTAVPYGGGLTNMG